MYTIGLGEYAITDVPEEKIITHALGSCVALILYCKKTKCTAMAHIVLPNYQGHQDHLRAKEAYFADDIVPRMIDFFKERPECQKDQLQVTLVGGSDSKNKDDLFKVGARNVNVIRDILDGYGLEYNAEETAGHFSRSVEIEVETGEISIKKNKMLL